MTLNSFSSPCHFYVGEIVNAQFCLLRVRSRADCPRNGHATAATPVAAPKTESRSRAAERGPL